MQHYKEDADGLVCNLKKSVDRKNDLNVGDASHVNSVAFHNSRTDGSIKSKDSDQKEMKNLMSGKPFEPSFQINASRS